jgi:hypothetical protein
MTYDAPQHKVMPPLSHPLPIHRSLVLGHLSTIKSYTSYTMTSIIFKRYDMMRRPLHFLLFLSLIIPLAVYCAILTAYNHNISPPPRYRRLLKYAAIVVYTHMPIAIYTVASSFADQDQPTHHTIWWWRFDLYTSYVLFSTQF